MKSQRQVLREYNKMIQDHYKEPVEPNRCNCYTCKDCGHITKTIDIDNGIIPMMFSCEQCGKIAMSSFFKDIAPDKQPTVEWYRPTINQTLKLRKKPSTLDHILNGGLEYRKINKQ